MELCAAALFEAMNEEHHHQWVFIDCGLPVTLKFLYKKETVVCLFHGSGEWCKKNMKQFLPLHELNHKGMA